MCHWMPTLFILSLSGVCFLCLTLSLKDMFQAQSLWGIVEADQIVIVVTVKSAFMHSEPCLLSCSNIDFPTLFTWHLQVQSVPSPIVLSKQPYCTKIPLFVNTKATGFSPVHRQQNLLLSENSLEMESEKNHMTQKGISLQEVFGLCHFVKTSLEGENNKVKHISGLKPMLK